MKQFLIGLLLFSNMAWASPYFWVQHVSEGLIVRSITDEFRCPDIKVAETDHQMTERFVFASAERVMRVCEYEFSSFEQATLYDQFLPKTPTFLDKIVVLGSSGHPSTAKHFEKIVDAVSREAPDLIIHLGNYTKSAYDPKNELSWSAWENQFFAPIQKIQTLAPFIFLRGEQEACQSAWFGWQIFLANGHYHSNCQTQFPTQNISFDDLQLIIHDSSNPENQFSRLTLWETSTRNTRPKEKWLLTSNSPYAFSDTDTNEQPSTGMLDLVKDSREINLIFSGQKRNFQATNISMNHPLFSQVVLGTSGDKLEKNNLEYPRQSQLNGILKHLNYSITQHGYLVLNREGKYWIALFKDPVGQPLVSCKITDNDIHCRSLFG